MRSIMRAARLFMASLALLSSTGHAFDLRISDTVDQVCSGVYAGPESYLEVSFDATSGGQIALVIYEWADARSLGVATSSDIYLPKTYVCTTDAVRSSLCSAGMLGQFIITLPANTTLAQTSIWTASVQFTASPSNSTLAADSLWDGGGAPTPTPPVDKYASPWLAIRAEAWHRADDHTTTVMPPTGSITYTKPIHYHISKTGYYCVGAIPVTVASTHAAFSGQVHYQNEFKGELSAADYPKITFYMVMMMLYALVAAGWGYLCIQHRYDLLAIQNYISALFALVTVEMLANWAYYRFQNAQGPGLASKVFLFVVSILDAGRNSLSFFLLLIVSLGLGVVKEELDFMNKCRILAGLHALFGVIYAVGMDLVELETVQGMILLMFVIPLAVTMTIFLLWIMYGLTGTIAELAARKQTYKLGMFRTLHRILMLAVLALFGFFVLSSMSFSSRYDEDYAPRTWKSRWWLLDGFLVLLYMAVFVSISFLWRPTGHNRRLAMSDELAQDEEDAEDYDLEAIQMRGERAKLEAMQGIDAMGEGTQRERGVQLPSDREEVVFEIGDEGSDDETADERKKVRRE